MGGMGLRLLCEVTAVLNIAAFLGKCVVFGDSFGSKYKAYFIWEMAEEFARCSEGIFRLFFVVSCPIAGLQLSVEKLKSSIPPLS